MKPTIIIIAGGLATRMMPITENIPKCLVDVNGTPLIQHQMEYFREKGYTHFIFCVAHLADKVKEYFKDGREFGVKIEYSQEPKELLGSAGAVKLIEGMIKNTSIIYYGDNLTNLDFDEFLDFHRQKKSKFSIFLRKCPEDYKASSLIILDDNQEINLFIEKPSQEVFEKYKEVPHFINNGIYIIEPELIQKIPPGVKCDFGKDIIPKIMKEDKVFGYTSDDFFIELGRVDKYENFLKNFEGRARVLDKKKAIFLDRDGVINKNVKDLFKVEQFELIEGSAQAIKMINDSEYLAIVVTNQPNLAKGLLDFNELTKMHEKMKEELAKNGAHIDGIYVCPHHPEKGFSGEIAELKKDCQCRKPKPGLILQAKSEFNLDLDHSWTIGDSLSDIQAGKEAGTRTILLTSGGGSGSKHEASLKVKPLFEKNDLLEAITEVILTHL